MYTDAVNELMKLKQNTTKNPKISVGLKDSAFDSLLMEQEKVTTTRNSTIQVNTCYFRIKNIILYMDYIIGRKQ